MDLRLLALATTHVCHHTWSMKALTVRLDALDPEAGDALRVIAYFDSLVAHQAGLNALLRAAAFLSAGPAALVDEDRSVRLRVDADGRTGQPTDAPDPAWPHLEFGSTPARLWLEQDGPARAVDALVLERAAAAIEPLLLRTRGRNSSSQPDEASVEILLSRDSSPEARSTAARRLRLPADGLVRAIAVHDGAPIIQRAPGPTTDADVEQGLRAGIGPAVCVAELPDSWDQARLALRLTAASTPRDPGPRVVRADQAGSQLLLASLIGADTPAPPDVVVVEDAIQAAPWMLETLVAIAYSTSMRAAAHQLRVHHSSAQERAARATRMLGWELDEPAGRFRLQLALMIRRLRATPAV